MDDKSNAILNVIARGNLVCTAVMGCISFSKTDITWNKAWKIIGHAA